MNTMQAFSTADTVRSSLLVAAGVVGTFLFLPPVPLHAEDAPGAGKIVQRRGSGKVHLVQYGNGKWQLMVDGAPYIVKGIEYSADPVGRTPDGSNEWMAHDANQNDKCDGPYDSWVDRNNDNFQDIDEESAGDFRLLKEMGANTIRIYHPDNIDKEVLRDLFRTYGIRVIMGNFLGAYTVGSGADWSCGTDYTDAGQRRQMLESVRAMVVEHKDEPYVLMWMLGNENDTAGDYANSTYNNTNAACEPATFAAFVNEACAMIKQLDPDHPVGICNATYRLFASYKEHAPALDIIGMNAYPGPYGFGTLWNRIRLTTGLPVLITEFGTDCYHQKKHKVDEDYQALYHRRAWNDIVRNSAWGEGAGNSLGGVVYCWLDKWWLSGSNKAHDVEAGARKGEKIDGWIHDEWLGVCGQGNGTRSPFLRQPRKAYYVYRDELWNRPLPGENDGDDALEMGKIDLDENGNGTSRPIHK